jgi:hypothetical protein
MAKVKVEEKEFRTKSGLVITDEVADRLADEVETEEEYEWTRKRPVGRPSLDGSGTSPRVDFRVPKELYDAAAERAISEERTVSAVAREALEKYLAG